MFIIQGLLNTQSLVLYGSKNIKNLWAIRAARPSNSNARSAIDCSPAILQNEKTG